jgi:hypothetical protein
MADLVITEENVRIPSGTPVAFALAAQNMGAGNLVYRLNTTHVQLANAADPNAAGAIGVTVDKAFTNQPVGYVTAGAVLNAATIPVGHVLVVSPNSGKACNHGDLSTNHYLTIVGYGANASAIALAIQATGVQRA